MFSLTCVVNLRACTQTGVFLLEMLLTINIVKISIVLLKKMDVHLQ